MIRAHLRSCPSDISSVSRAPMHSGVLICDTALPLSIFCNESWERFFAALGIWYRSTEVDTILIAPSRNAMRAELSSTFESMMSIVSSVVRTANAAYLQFDVWEQFSSFFMGVVLRAHIKNIGACTILLDVAPVPNGESHNHVTLGQVLDSALGGQFDTTALRRVCEFGLPMIVVADAATANSPAVLHTAFYAGRAVVLPCAAHMCNNAVKAAIKSVPGAQKLFKLQSTLSTRSWTKVPYMLLFDERTLPAGN